MNYKINWSIRNKATQDKLDVTFDSKDDANTYITESMGSAFANAFEAVPNVKNDKVARMLTEGLVKGDLRHILLPRISVDEYVPGDPESDNVVIAFFIKGVPESVIPFRDFLMHTSGVIDVAYGDSDTLPNTSIAYAEMDRKNFNYDAFFWIMEQITLLTYLNVEDFTLVFPTSSRKYPYSPEVLKDYFASRSQKANMKAQKAAFDSASEDEPTDDEVEEALVEFLVESLK